MNAATIVPGGPPGLSGGERADFHDEWVAALERLEIDVALAEGLLAVNAEPEPLPEWTPPVMRGPLPSDLEPRARLVLERQLAVTHRIAERLTVTGQHRRYTQAVRATAHPDVPIYIDLSA